MKNYTKALLFLLITSVSISSCKDDSPYYDVENKLQEFDGNAIAYLQAQPNTYDSLLKVLERLPELKNVLTNEQVTLFAPTNQNFIAALSDLNFVRKSEGRTLINLNTATIEELNIMMCKYIIAEKRTTDAFKAFLDGIYVPSIKIGEQMHIQYNKLDASGYVAGGPQSVTFSDTKNGFVRAYWERAQISVVNIKTSNAIIYVLNPLHVFGFNEFTSRLNK
ncbi:fasciclin domain-containing protein [Pedobacter heparinus]|uniref:fasciclin domain-containing protein n=1 Tax=Pedobacter heparinus TaxID=984 RepID=UPI002931007E|nr:fasciclin domain-containing protein [Pedobacter heparinus]